MSPKSIDVVVLGATGFTGARVADVMAKVAQRDGLSFALSGRDLAKLEKVRERICRNHNLEKKAVPLLTANASDLQSLVKVTSQCRVLLNCVGPYRFTGQTIVQACILGKSDYLDITGEPQFIEVSSLKSHEDAVRAGILVVHACGFDSMPADLGVRWCSDLAKQKGISLSRVEGFLQIEAPDHFVGNFTTYETGVHSVSKWQELGPLRQELIKARWPKPVPRAGKESKVRKVPFVGGVKKKWSLLYPGSDAAVVKNTQKSLVALGWSEPLPRYHAYISFDKLPTLLMTMGLAAVFVPLATVKPGRALLLKYPGFFSGGTLKRGGPSDEQIANTRFSIEFQCYGENEDDVPAFVAKVAGPEPGYVATPLFMVESAAFLLKDRQSVVPTAGVYTPAVVFSNPSVLSQLRESGITFS